MNITNFEPIDYSFYKIFTLQREIKFEYEPTAREIFENFDIDTFEDQEIFKKYCWRITEELTEALEDLENTMHLKEELIDSLNFLIELYLLCGVKYSDLENYPYPSINQKFRNPVKLQILEIIKTLGLTANLLKNRQWRQSQYLVDLFKFEPRLKSLWPLFMELFRIINMNEEEVKQIWSLKYQVNKFRINSNY